MNASSTVISNAGAQEAFAPGADLWVIQNKPESKWWQEIDYRSRFLLSRNYFHSKKEIPSELADIIKATSMQEPQKIDPKNYVLIGSSDHFLNKWILIWNDLSPLELCKAVESLSKDLKFDSVRFFSHVDELKKVVKTRPTTSSLTISYIE